MYTSKHVFYNLKSICFQPQSRLELKEIISIERIRLDRSQFIIIFFIFQNMQYEKRALHTIKRKFSNLIHNFLKFCYYIFHCVLTDRTERIHTFIALKKYPHATKTTSVTAAANTTYLKFYSKIDTCTHSIQ